MKYRVIVTLEVDDVVDPVEIAEHCAVACAAWGGQYSPEDPLFSAYVEATATCRGNTVTTKEQEDDNG